MAYSSTEARHRMGVSARAYRVLHQWALDCVGDFTGRHEDMSWSRLEGLTAGDLLKRDDCGHKTLDEIAAAMREAGLSLPGHAASMNDAITLARGSKVYLAGRMRPLIVTDVGHLGDDVLLRLRLED